MNPQNRKRQHVEQQQEEDDNGNEMREPELKIAALEAKNGVLSAVDLAKVNEENGALGQELKEAEEKAQMSNNENSLDRHLLRVPLPLELNCQIFACLKFESQRKFIGGLGRGIYGMFRHKVLRKCKSLRNPEHNGWKVSNTDAIIDSNGILARNNIIFGQNVSAKKGFPITGELSRTDNFPGIILYYFEITIMSSYRGFLVGLSSGNIPDGSWVGRLPNSYAIPRGCDYCWLSGTYNIFERPNGVIRPEWNGQGDVVGCGLVLNPANELSIFFTGNGILMGKQISINSTANSLYPTVAVSGYGSVEANFGDDLAKPFSYDSKKCPGMGFE